uniref:StAR-related lipid transfer (START) domain containing protein-like protein n=1 Tax=Philodina roseola TaxID=96448 RepID=B6S362_PHIRO|nr:StAR-related lipid transfer (START) domain containing protein-like protein [Philodina roseola]
MTFFNLRNLNSRCQDRRISTRRSSHSTSLAAHRHYHIYDWSRLSFYDNVPSILNYLSEPLVAQDRSPTSTSSTDRRDSGLETSSVERHIDSLTVPKTDLQQSRSSLSSSSSSSSSSSPSSSSNDHTTTNPTMSSSRLPNSRKIRVKWHSFTKTHRPSFNSSKYHLGQMSVGQLVALRRVASVRIQELQCLIATAFSAVPKLIIRRHQQRKEIHHEMKKSVFGLSLLAMTQRTGHPVPISIISAMKYLRRTAMDSVGLFRKPGVANRIKRLHDLIETNRDFHQFNDFSPYDISDVLKQYFRLLPECLFTTKLSPIFLNINENLSTMMTTTTVNSVQDNNERRLLILQYAILLLPDEHRLVLHLLLSFLNDVSKHSKSNQMSSMNLATCFAPTLFSFEHYQKSSSTSQGMPDFREIHDQRKAMEILAFMIDHVRQLFLVPNELHRACHFSYIEIGEPCTLDELARRAKRTNSYQSFINRCIVEMIRESCYTKLKGWTSFGKNNELNLAFKKLDDGHPLGLWKCSIEISAPPLEILNRLLNERNLWDDDFQSGSVVEQLNRHTHVYQYVINSMAPLASRYFSTNVTNGNQREACVLVCTSIEHPKGRCPPTLVRAVTLASRYLIQSNGCGKSKVTHLSRIDLMGRSPEWYTKAYGPILSRSMMKLRDSFVQLNNSGPETKV